MSTGILGVIGDTLACKIIQIRTPQKGILKQNIWSHVAYKFDEKVIESHFHSGVKIWDYADWLVANKTARIEFIPSDNFDIGKLKSFKGEKYGTQNILAIAIKTDLEFVRKFAEKKRIFTVFAYPFMFAGNFIVNKTNKDYKGIFCSELLVKSAKNNYLEIALSKPAHDIYPSDIQKLYLNSTKEVIQ